MRRKQGRYVEEKGPGRQKILNLNLVKEKKKTWMFTFGSAEVMLGKKAK